MATHGGRGGFMKIWWTRDNTIPRKQLSDLATAQATTTAVCIATTNFRREGITVALVCATGVFCKPALASLPLTLRCASPESPPT